MSLALRAQEGAPSRTDSLPELLTALDCLRVAVTLFDSRERLIYASRHINHLFRSLPDRSQLIGMRFEDILRIELDGGEIARDGQFADIENYIAFRRGQLRAGDFAPRDIELSNGRVAELKVRRTPEGGWITLWSDATDARHLMRRLETAVELSADAFSFWDSDDRLVLCNDSFAELHGFASAEQLTGKLFRDITAEAVRRARFEIDGKPEHWIERRLDTHRAPAGALTLTTTTGEAYLVRDRATRDGGRATVFTDITERHRAEIALAEQSVALAQTADALKATENEAKKQSRYLADMTRRLGDAEAEADTAKTALLRTMSHELKTPLNSILGFADLLRIAPDRFTSEQIAEYSGLIHLAGQNLLKLINQILDLTKIAAGRFPLRRRELATGAALWAATDGQSARAAEKRIALDIGDCQSDLLVDADEGALCYMIGQLVENAVNFTQEGGQVCLAAEPADGFIRITVSDNGPGVCEEDLARIQEPFEQVGRGTTDHTNGAGLGLPLVKGLAELHGGSLSIASVVGEGFTATLHLPAA